MLRIKSLVRWHRILCLGLLVSISVQALPFKQEWDAISGAEFYEYEISEASQFKAEDLFRQGQLPRPTLEIDLRPGVYYLRMRAIEGEGRTGRWSSTQRIVIPGQVPVIRLPVRDERIEVVSPASPIFFRWKTVDGATDYEVRLSSKSQKGKTYIVESPTLITRDLTQGSWELQVFARVRGEPISQSEALPFFVTTKNHAPPRIIEPLDGDVIPAWELFPIRWTRQIPGPRSEVVVSRMDQGGAIISREPVWRTSQTRTPALPPGRYQISVRDFVEGSDSQEPDASQGSVTVTVLEDPMGYHSQYLGVTWRLMSGGVFWGWSALKNPAHGPDYLRGSAPLKSPHAFDTLESRFQSRVWTPWGLEILTAADRYKYYLPERQSNAVYYGFRTQFGPTYRLEPWGPTKPILLKGLIHYRDLRQVAEIPGSPITTSLLFGDSAVTHRNSYYQIWGATTGAELRWGGWNRAWDALAEIKTDIPLMAFGRVLGAGTPLPLPTFQLELLIRRKIADELRVFIGGQVRFEHLSVSNGGTNSALKQSRSLQSQALGGVRAGLDIDL